MQYEKGKHYTFYHRYHLIWITKYSYKALTGDIRLRVREIIRQVCAENHVDIVKGVLATDHVHMFVSIPPKPRNFTAQSKGAQFDSLVLAPVLRGV